MTQMNRGPEPRTVEYFDAAADGYSARYRQNTPGSLAFRIRKQQVLELFDQPGGRVLDVGCGPGVIVRELLARNCRFVGIDPAPSMIAQARAAYGSESDASFSVGAAEKIDHDDASFDAVICMGVFERVGDPDAALREMTRVLAPGGTLLITLPSRHSPYFVWRDYLFYPLVALVRGLYYALVGRRRPVTIPGHSLFSATHFRRLLESRGFDVTEVAYSGFNPILPPFESLLPRIAAFAMEKLEWLRRTPLRYLGAGVIIRARKR